jgi:transcription elongation factor S-II
MTSGFAECPPKSTKIGGAARLPVRDGLSSSLIRRQITRGAFEYVGFSSLSYCASVHQQRLLNFRAESRTPVRASLQTVCSAMTDKKDDSAMRKKLSASKSIEKPASAATKETAKKLARPSSDAATASKPEIQGTGATAKPAVALAGAGPGTDAPLGKGGGGGRTISSHPSGDAMRDKVRQLLATALYVEGDGLNIDKDAALATAIDVESAMFSALGGVGNEYKMKARELKFNFSDAKNKDLRAEVLDGSLTPAALVKMTSKDLANADMKAERQRLHNHFLREMAASNVGTATTDEFRCGKCKKRECTYYELQTRGADEPLTVFVSCTSCGNRWRF